MGMTFSNPFQGALAGPISLTQTFNTPTAGTYAAGFGANLTISPTTVNNTLWQGVGVVLTDAVGEAYGVNGTLTAISGIAGSETGNTISAVTGGYFAAIAGYTNASGKITTAIGVDALVQTNTGSGGITNAYGVRASVQQNSGTGSITTAYGVYIPSMPASGAGITTQVGLQIDNQNLGGSFFAIRTGLGPVLFGDQVSIAASKGLNLGDTTLKNYQEGTFTPTFTGLTVVNGTGSVTFSGRYTRIGNRVDWEITIQPSGSATSQSVAGSTFCNNLPFTGSNGSNCLACDNSTGLSLGTGAVLASTTQAYTPSWAANNHFLVVTGTIFL